MNYSFGKCCDYMCLHFVLMVKVSTNSQFFDSFLCKMTNFEVLKLFFKVFEIFGLQYFSFKDLERIKNDKRPGKFHIFYFLFVLILFSSTMILYVAFTIDTREKRITVKTGFNVMIRFFMNFGLIFTIVAGIIESFVKTDQLKDLYTKIKEVSSMCLSHFDFEIDYSSFHKAWRIKFFTGLILYIISYSEFILFNAHPRKAFFNFAIGFFPILFFGLIVFKLSFHVDLVNFQLQNLNILMSKEVFLKINPTNSVNIKYILQSRALAVRKIYNLIYDISEIVNNFFAFSALSTIVVLTIIIINTSFRCIVEMTKGFASSKFARKKKEFQLCKLKSGLKIFQDIIDILWCAIAMIFVIVHHCQKTKNIVSIICSSPKLYKFFNEQHLNNGEMTF